MAELQQQQDEPLATTVVRASPYEGPGAPPLPAAPVAAFTAGETIGKTLRVWWKNLVPFTIISVVVSAPMAVWLVDFQRRLLELKGVQAAGGRVSPPELGSMVVQIGVLSVLTAVLQVVALGAITRGAFGHLRGERISFGAMLGTGFRRGLPVVGAALVAWLAMTGAALLLVFPAVMLGCAWAACIPAAVVERTGPLRALSRSAELTRGFRWRVLGVFAALFGIVWGLALVVQLGGGAVALLALPAAQAPLATMIVSQLGTALFSCIPSVGCAVVYHDLRAAREGLDQDQLASVFD